MKPIIFSTSMIRVILEGQKTQTRRVVKRPKGIPDTYYPARIAGRFWWCENGHSTGVELFCPYGRPGQVLWVREALKCVYPDNDGEGWVAYKADGRMVDPDRRWWWQRENLPSIFMPRWACRLFLKITDVRVERVQDITREDARDEGYPPGISGDNAIEWFCQLWDSINFKRGFGWDVNPWVWVNVFEVVK